MNTLYLYLSTFLKYLRHHCLNVSNIHKVSFFLKNVFPEILTQIDSYCYQSKRLMTFLKWYIEVKMNKVMIKILQGIVFT